MASSSEFPLRCSAEGLLVPAVHCVGPEPWRLVEMDSGRVSTYSSYNQIDHERFPALAGCGRRCATMFAWGERRFPLDTELRFRVTRFVWRLPSFSRPSRLPSTHRKCGSRSESSMKPSTSFTESEDQCLHGQFKGFENRERLVECSALLLRSQYQRIQQLRLLYGN